MCEPYVLRMKKSKKKKETLGCLAKYSQMNLLKFLLKILLRDQYIIGIQLLMVLIWSERWAWLTKRMIFVFCLVELTVSNLTGVLPGQVLKWASSNGLMGNSLAVGLMSLL